MLRKRNLKRYNPFKEFETKYEEGENILTKIRRILDENEPPTIPSVVPQLPSKVIYAPS